jgi:hypothetical protein
MMISKNRQTYDDGDTGTDVCLVYPVFVDRKMKFESKKYEKKIKIYKKKSAKNFPPRRGIEPRSPA